MTFTLCNTDIERMIDTVETFLSGRGMEKRNILRTRLIVEEVLLTYQEKFGPETRVTLTQERHFRRVRLVLGIPGASFDPFAETDQQAVLHRLLSSVSIDPAWSYKHGRNCIAVSPEQKKKLSGLAWILLALVLGVVCGLAAQHLPEPLLTVVTDDVLTPLSETIMSFLSGMALFLTFFSVITGLCCMGDMSTFKRIGKKMIGKFVLTLGAFLLIAYAVLLPFFNIVKDGSAVPDGKALYTMLLDIVPGNVIQSFSAGNTMQIIFLAICIGITMLALSPKLNGIQDIFVQLADLSQHIVVGVIRLLPVIVFISMFQTVALRQFSAVSTVYRYPLLVALADAVFIIIDLLRVGLTKKVSPLKVFKKILPVFTITMATSSSIAAFTTILETCRNKLGIHKELVDVGVPLGQVIFMPGSIVEVLGMALCMAHMYGTPVTGQWLVTLAVIAFVLSIAMPPLPGATISGHVLVLAQLGIPAEAIAIVIAFDALIDRLSTSANIAMLQMELVQVAGSLDMLDNETLKCE